MFCAIFRGKLFMFWNLTRSLMTNPRLASSNINLSQNVWNSGEKAKENVRSIWSQIRWVWLWEWKNCSMRLWTWCDYCWTLSMLAFVIQSVLTYGPMLAFYLCIQGICALRWVNIFPLEHLVVSRLQNKPTPNLLYVHVCLLSLKIFIWLSAYMFFRTSVCVCGCRVEDAALGICSNSSRAFSTCLLSTLVIDLLCVCRRWYEKQATLDQVTLAFQPFMREASMLFMLLLGLGLDPWAKFDQARHMYAHPFTTHFLLSSLMEYALYIAGCGIINSYTTECVAYIWLSL